jgi:hypothetical protein
LICLSHGWKSWTFLMLVSIHIQLQNVSDSKDDNGDARYQQSVVKMCFIIILNPFIPSEHDCMDQNVISGHATTPKNLNLLPCTWAGPSVLVC